jgi:hypothetical protein
MKRVEGVHTPLSLEKEELSELAFSKEKEDAPKSH